MRREKSVAIPETLWNALQLYFLDPSMRIPSVEGIIIDEINAKIDRQLSHDLYTKSKTAPTAEEKERARIAYLDRKGIRDSFRW